MGSVTVLGCFASMCDEDGCLSRAVIAVEVGGTKIYLCRECWLALAHCVSRFLPRQLGHKVKLRDLPDGWVSI